MTESVVFAGLRTPGYSWCKRCGTTWDRTPHHTTWYCASSGAFPLCQACWEALQMPELRLPYYKLLWDAWQEYPMTNPVEWDEIEAAVRAGK